MARCLIVDKMASDIKWRIVLVVCAVMKMGDVLASQEVMTKMTVGFAKVMQECRNELSVGDHIIQDFYNFWREEYDLVNRDMGCMVICMASKLDLIDEDSNKMHHGNAQAFAKAHGANDDLAKQLVDVLHQCEKTHAGVEDPCSRALETAKCFRAKIHDLKWAPSMEVILEELMVDVKQ